MNNKKRKAITPNLMNNLDKKHQKQQINIFKMKLFIAHHIKGFNVVITLRNFKQLKQNNFSTLTNKNGSCKDNYKKLIKKYNK